MDTYISEKQLMATENKTKKTLDLLFVINFLQEENAKLKKENNNLIRQLFELSESINQRMKDGVW